MSNVRSYRLCALTVLAALVLVFSGWATQAAETKKKEDLENRPERSIQMSAEFPGVEVSPGQNVTMNLIFDNNGRRDENIDVSIPTVPRGWKARIKAEHYAVTALSVTSGEQKTVTFEAEPDKTVKPGDYKFDVQANTIDKKFKMDQAILVKVREPRVGAEARGVRLITSYPVLRGSSDASFEFSVDVDNKLDRDAVFDLSSQAPEGWEINFKPAYETKFITSLRIKANSTQTVAIQAKPPAASKAGEYPITMRVASGEAKAEAKLMVVLTGTYSLDAGTPSGLLTLDARQGKPSVVSIFVKNTGSAPLQGITFTSTKPENWKVEYKPEKVDSLDANDLKQVEITVTPPDKAVAGDYAVGVAIKSEKASKDLDFRVTVRGSSSWAWIGIAIIVLVVIGLTGLFRWLGRR